MEFRILGPLEVVRDGVPLTLGRGKQRALVGLLLLHANQSVSTDRLIDELWGERPPGTARAGLLNYVSQLRKLLGPQCLETCPPGYLLRVDPGELDRERFELLLSEGRYAEALSLFRGPPLWDFAFEPFAQAEIVRLEDLRLAALEQRIDQDLAAGRHLELVSDLEGLTADHPLRERFRAQLMLALYRSGRQAEALEVFQAARKTFVDELGIDPGKELRELQRQILEQDATLEWVPAPVPAVAPLAALPAPESEPPRRHEQRKVVTVVACELDEASTAGEEVDPELLRPILTRYHEAVATVVAGHGGSVETLVGRSATAVFGVPVLHEDDALRALRAASDFAAALAARLDERLRGRFEPALRIGISTGEVIAGDEPGVTGDAVNVAVQLARTAAPSETLFAEATFRLVRDAVRAEPRELEGKHRRKPLSAWRLREVSRDATPVVRPVEAALVGRERELRKLRDAFAETVERRTPYLFTLLGPAGIGKTRLATEFASAVAHDARVLAGRCLPYGEGITYWPLVEIGRELGQDVAAAIRRLLSGERDAELVAERVGAAVGQGKSFGRDETFWAVRRLFEGLGRTRPLVLVFEDLHWAEATLLDLVEHVVELARESPLFVLCLARPELLEERPGWGGGKPNASSLLLEPLSEDEAEGLIAALLGAASLAASDRRRIAEAAEGNPLFVEQMLATLSLGEQANGELEVPPTIQALLAARLDRLGPGERAVVEAAAVAGREFSPAALIELLPEEARPSLERHLQSLVRKELVRPGGSPLFGAEALRFRHILIRDAAYRGLPKAQRALLHESFADWLEQQAGAGLSEYDEILGYHLEQAYRYRSELGQTPAELVDLAERAADALTAAARRALAGEDVAAVLSFSFRAASLLDESDPRRREMLVLAGTALRLAGEIERAEAVLTEALERARAAHDGRTEKTALLLLAHTRVTATPSEDVVGELVAAAEDAIPVLAETEDHSHLARARLLLGWALLLQRRASDAGEVLEQAAADARAAGNVRDEGEALFHLGDLLVDGATPVEEALVRLDQMRKRVEGDRVAASGIDLILAKADALRGRFEDARARCVQARTILSESGHTLFFIDSLRISAQVELLADDVASAETYLRQALARAQEVGHNRAVGEVAGLLAEVRALQRDDGEAERLGETQRQLATSRYQQARWRAVQAKALAGRGELDAAEALAREALELSAEGYPLERAARLIDLAGVLELQARSEEARVALQEALDLLDHKGSVVSAERVRTRLEHVSRRTVAST